MRGFERRMEKWQDGLLGEYWERQYARRPGWGRRREVDGRVARCWGEGEEWRFHEDLIGEHEEQCVRAYWAQFYYDSSDEEEPELFEMGGAGDRRVEEADAALNENVDVDEGEHVEPLSIGGSNTANVNVDAPAYADDSDAGNNSDDEAEAQGGISEDEESDSEDSDSDSDSNSNSNDEIEIDFPDQHTSNSSLFNGNLTSSDSNDSSDYGNSDDDHTVQGTLYVPRPHPPPPRRLQPRTARPIDSNNTSDSDDDGTGEIYRDYARVQENARARNLVRQRNEMRQQRIEARQERSEIRWQRMMDRNHVRALRLRQQSYAIAMEQHERYIRDLSLDGPSSPVVPANDESPSEQQMVEEEAAVATFLTSRTYRARDARTARELYLADSGSRLDLMNSGEPSIPRTSNPSSGQTGEESLSTTTTTSPPTPTMDAGPQTGGEILNDGIRGAAERYPRRFPHRRRRDSSQE